MGKLVLFFLLLGSNAFAQETCRSKPLIFVPGFFSVFKQEGTAFHYFSPTILRTAEQFGYSTYVVNDLDPVGSIAENGARLERELPKIQNLFPGCELTFLGHSAGGLYIAHALTHFPQTPVKAVITISTPYAGSDILRLVKLVPGWRKLAQWLNLESIREFAPETMAEIVGQFHLPNVPWILVGAEQKTCFLLSCALPSRMNWVLSAPWTFTPDRGDGMVSLESSYALQGNAAFFPARGVERWTDLTFPLDHMKSVHDASFFNMLGQTDSGWVDRQQVESYAALFRRLQ